MSEKKILKLQFAKLSTAKTLATIDDFKEKVELRKKSRKQMNEELMRIIKNWEAAAAYLVNPFPIRPNS